MFYAEQKAYPYNFIIEANETELNTTNMMSDRVMEFSTRKKAEQYFKDCGWLTFVTIKSNKSFKVNFYKNGKDIYPDIREFDDRTHLNKYLKESGLVTKYDHVSITKSKVFDGMLVQINGGHGSII